MLSRNSFSWGCMSLKHYYRTKTRSFCSPVTADIYNFHCLWIPIRLIRYFLAPLCLLAFNFCNYKVLQAILCLVFRSCIFRNVEECCYLLVSVLNSCGLGFISIFSNLSFNHMIVSILQVVRRFYVRFECFFA